MTGVKSTQRARDAAGGWKLTTASKRMVEASPTSQWNAYKGAQYMCCVCVCVCVCATTRARSNACVWVCLYVWLFLLLLL